CNVSLERVQIEAVDLNNVTMVADRCRFDNGGNYALTLAASSTISIMNSIVTGLFLVDGGTVLLDFDTIYQTSGMPAVEQMGGTTFAGVTVKNSIVVAAGSSNSANCGSCTFT